MSQDNNSGLRACIFCGGESLSKEHICPRWMRNYLPSLPGGTRHFVNFTRYNPDGSFNYEVNPEGRLTQKGEHRSRVLRVVCKNCNETWMSQLQMAAKPILEPMLVGIYRPLSVAEQNILASWVVMQVMVFEFADIKTIAISDDQRRQFKEDKLPPRNWLIWFGRFPGVSKKIYHTHRGMGVGSDRSRIEGVDGRLCNTQVTIFAMGNCFFCAASSNSDISNAIAKKLRWSILSFGLCRIWPNVRKNEKLLGEPGSEVMCSGVPHSVADDEFLNLIDKITSIIVEGKKRMEK